MKRTITLASVIALAGCPADDAPSDDSATATGSVDESDLPDDESTTTETAGDGDGDPTATGDGDGDPTTTGDGDGDGDTGSEAEPHSLIVESNGERIGYLMGVWDHGYSVWDDVNDVMFRVNQQTGHVSGRQSFYYTTADCSGQKYMIAPYEDPGACGNPGPPVHANVVGHDGAASGYIAATALWMPSGAASMVMTQSVNNGGACSQLAFEICAYPYESTGVIPKTFALPITVAEALP